MIWCRALGRSNKSWLFLFGEIMNRVELSLWIEANYPSNKSSFAKRKPLFGVGVNDANYATQPIVNGCQLCDPAYESWRSMLTRAYSQKFHATNRTYSDVTVCKEWHSFSAFRVWWLENYREDCQLDKDILVPGNREYSPDSCIYVPRWLNSFLNDRGASRGELPIGVSIHKQTGRCQSHCSNPITGKLHGLGTFATPEAAHQAWLTYKLSLAEQLKPEMDAIDVRIYPNVVTIIKSA